MTQKRILRANARNATRERGLTLREAFRAHGADIDDPAAANLILELTQDDPEQTALTLFEMASRLIDEVAELSGEVRDTVYARVQPD
jgi:hypothetical protein